MSKRFCEWQYKCREDTVDSWTCTAKLDSGRAFECPYKYMRHAKGGKYPCVDAKPPETETKEYKPVRQGVVAAGRDGEGGGKIYWWLKLVCGHEKTWGQANAFSPPVSTRCEECEQKKYGFPPRRAEVKK
jgi:hypothetical protein